MNIMMIMNSFNLGGSSKSMLKLADILEHKIIFVFLHKVLADFPRGKYKYFELNIPREFLVLSKIFEVSLKISQDLADLKKDNDIEVAISSLIVPNIINSLSKGKEKVVLICRSNYSNVLFGVDFLIPKYISNDMDNKIKIINKNYNRADKIVAISKGSANCLKEDFGIDKSKIEIIPNYINFEKIINSMDDVIDEKIVNVYDNKTILHVGRLSKEKNQDGLIRIFNKLRQKIFKIRLVIVGEGPEKENLINYSKALGLSVWNNGRGLFYNNEDVIFIGAQDNPYKFMKMANVFVLTSQYEGLGNVLIEALATGCKIMSADCFFGPREIIAPDTDVNKKTKKPEITNIGVLLPDLCPNEKNDKVWIDLLVKTINEEIRFERNNLINRALDFDVKFVKAKWDKLMCSFIENFENKFNLPLKDEKRDITVDEFSNSLEYAGWLNKIDGYKRKIVAIKKKNAVINKSTSLIFNLTYGNKNYFLLKLKALKEKYANFELIVVDSSKESFEIDKFLNYADMFIGLKNVNKYELMNIVAILTCSKTLIYTNSIIDKLEDSIELLIDEYTSLGINLISSSYKNLSSSPFFITKYPMSENLVVVDRNFLIKVGGWNEKAPKGLGIVELSFRLENQYYIKQKSSDRILFDYSKFYVETDDYSHLIKSFSSVFNPLIYTTQQDLFLKLITDLIYGRELFQSYKMYNKLGYIPSLKLPKSFNEKIAHIMLNDVPSNAHILADKYLVRKYVSDKGLGYILNDVYYVFERPEEIPFENLPEKFVLKTNNGWGTNILVNDKNKISKNEVIKKIYSYLEKSKIEFFISNEYHYFKIKPKIIIEKYIEDSSGDLLDYKFHCFSGKVEFIHIVRRVNGELSKTIYDTKWNRLPFSHNLPQGKGTKKPQNLNKMINIAEKLSEDLIYCRVDLYNIDDKLVIFGELTLTPAACKGKFYPEEFDYKFGKLINLDRITNNKKNEVIQASSSQKEEINTSQDNFKFSICIPTFNRAHYIKDAISSVLNQSYKDYELIIVDDGSTDNTKEIVESFKSDKIRYFYKGHTNLPDTRNHCIDKARGEYIIWLDSDDLLHQDLLACYARFLDANPVTDTLCCNLVIFEDNSKVITSYANLEELSTGKQFLKQIFYSNPFRNPGFLVRKSIYKEFGNYNLEFLRAHDIEFASRLALNATFKPMFINKYLCYQRMHDNNISGQLDQITCDFSYEIKILNNILSKKPIKEIFFDLDWSNEKDAYYNAYIQIIKRFLRFNGLQEAITKAKEYNMKYPSELKMRDVINYLITKEKSHLIQYEIFSHMESKGINLKFVKDYLNYLAFTLNNEKIRPLEKKRISDTEIINSLRNQIQFCLKEKQYNNSIYLHEALLIFLPGNIDLCMNIANQHYILGNHNLALENIKKVMSVNPKNSEAMLMLKKIEIERSKAEKIDINNIIGRSSHNQKYYTDKLFIKNHEDRNGLTQQSEIKVESDNFNYEQEFIALDKSLKENDIKSSLKILDQIIEKDPLNHRAALFLKMIENNADKNYLNYRENRFLQRLEENSESENTILEAIQFNNSQRVMSYVKEMIMNIKTDYVKSDDDKLVSIIMTVFNQADEIEKSINSVIDQSYSSWELIIIDDGSEDSSWEVIEQVKKRYWDKNIRIIRQTNTGVSLARNNATKQAKGEFLVFLDCGDELAPDYLLESVRALEEDYGISWVFPITVYTGYKNRLWFYKDFDYLENFRAHGQPVTSMMRKTMFDDIGGFDPDFKHGYEDWDFFLNAISKGYVGKSLKKILFAYHRSVQSRSIKLENTAEQEYQSKLLLIRKNPKCYKRNLTEYDYENLKSRLGFADSIINQKFELENYHKTNFETGDKLKILIFYSKNIDIPIFDFLIKELSKQKDNFNLALAYNSNSNYAEKILSEAEIKIINEYNLSVYNNPQDFEPDVTLIADTVYSLVQGCGKIIYIGHGIISKGQYYTNTYTAKREEYADLVCVPGLYHREILKRLIDKPVIVTGMSKLDPIFNKAITRATVIEKYGLPSEKKYILFAPTFNDELSAIPFVKDRINEILPDNDTLLLIKLHGSAKKEYQVMYRELVNKDSRVIYVDELDVTPFLALADILISDVSSVIYEFAALDKPVILFNNPNWKSYKNYDPNDLEFRFRDIGYQVNSLEELKNVLLQINRDNDPYKEKRKETTDMLIANKYDGKATERIIQTIKKSQKE